MSISKETDTTFTIDHDDFLIQSLIEHGHTSLAQNFQNVVEIRKMFLTAGFNGFPYARVDSSGQAKIGNERDIAEVLERMRARTIEILG